MCWSESEALLYHVASPPAISVQIAILHTYRDSENRSMYLYARRLEEALAVRDLDVLPVEAPPIIRGAARIPALSRVDSLAGRFVRYPRVARRVRADVYHIVDHAQAHLVRELDPARTVVTCHDVILLALAAGRIPVRHRDPLATRIFRWSVSFLRSAAQVVAVSERTRRDLIELVGIEPERLEVIPPGLNHPLAPAPERREESRRRLGLRRVAVLHVGHAGFYKNVEGCLRVLGKVRALGLDAELVRVGEPLHRAQRELASRLRLTEHVRELGPVDAPTLASVYASADVLLFPSLYEGFGWPPLEAMASGLPVVCSDAGALPEVVGDAALTAHPLDDDAMVALLLRVCGDRRLADELRARGLRNAARFDWASTARRYATTYEHTMKGAE